MGVKFCVIGAGAQGSAVAAILAKGTDADTIVLADYNVELAERVTAKIGDKRISTAKVDATDVDSVASVARGCDVILNLVHMDYAQTVRHAALEVGCHCVDSCSEPGFLHDIAFDHVVRDDEAFKTAGSRCVTGAGWAPGVANVVARYAADQLDEVDELYIRLGYENFGTDPAAVAHPWLPHFSPEVALQDFGDKIGRQLIASHSHDESYTLPYFIGKGIRECDFRYPVNDQAATFVAMGMADPKREVPLKDDTRVKPFDVIMACVKRPEDNFFAETPENIAKGRNTDRAIFVEASGRRDGVPLRVRLPYYVHVTTELRQRLYETFGTTTVWVAAPMVVAARMVLRGQAPEGVVSPEALDPVVFLKDLHAMGYPITFGEEYRLDRVGAWA